MTHVFCAFPFLIDLKHILHNSQLTIENSFPVKTEIAGDDERMGGQFKSERPKIDLEINPWIFPRLLYSAEQLDCRRGSGNGVLL